MQVVPSSRGWRAADTPVAQNNRPNVLLVYGVGPHAGARLMVGEGDVSSRCPFSLLLNFRPVRTTSTRNPEALGRRVGKEQTSVKSVVHGLKSKGRCSFSQVQLHGKSVPCCGFTPRSGVFRISQAPDSAPRRCFYC